MLTISDYCIVARLYESVNSLIYRGYRISDKQPVVLKMLKDAYPIPERIAWFKREYKVTRNLLTIPGVVNAYTLIRDRERPIMVLEDFGGDSLTLLGIAGQLELSAFLKLAIAVTKILGQIHAANIIHKDINPSNIVLNRTTEEVKIIDFGISTVLSKENPIFSNPNILEGTLAYISPEQTGRMNRAIDYRTDFYSLGVTFYELLTGILPFESSDTLELMHSHIAKQPISPYELVRAHSHPSLPLIISDIVMKLMAKNAEDRYQSADGLLVDLETCLHQLQTNGQIGTFSLGQQDISERFQIPQKLYGREQEIKMLLAAFVRVACPENLSVATTVRRKTISQPKIPNLKSQIEMVLVTGYSGVGKSALVREAHKLITARRGNFISGKFDQYQRNIPYYALSKAFNDLCNQMLTESESVLNEWREKILAAVGNNGQVLIDIIPNLERVIGLQPLIVQVGPSEAQNRFNLVFQNFIQAICQRSHPLVLFIDDLQWVDSASLNLLKTIASDTDIQYLLIIGAYRDNEVEATHPLAIALEEIQQKQGILSFIHLDNLRPQDVNTFTAKALACSPTSTQPLTDLVYEKTQGNPFFTSEFLRSLHAEGLLTFNKPTRKWDWDVRQIQAKDFTDNIVELMASKIAKLNTTTQSVLQLAACIGNQFNLSTLGTIYQHQPIKVLADLFPAIQEGLVIPLNNKYKLIEAGDIAADEAIFKFLHDRVQQAAYSLIDEAQKTTLHLQIGRLLLQSTPPEELSDRIFEIVDCLNLGLKIETLSIISLHQEERDKIANLNLIAGQKAKSAMAYEAALKYFNIGLKLLAEDSWQTQYDLTLNLYESAVYAEYLNTNYERSQHLSNIVIQQVKTVREKANIYEIKIQLYIAQNQMQDSIEIGLEFLKMLGVSLSQVAPSEVIIDDLYNLPPMRDPDKLAAMRILKAIWSPIHMTNSPLAPSIVFTMVDLCVNYGNSSFAAFAYVLYGLLLCRTQANLDLGYQLGKLSLKMLEFDASELKGRVYLMFNCCIRPWKEHKNSTLQSLLETLKILLEIGDIEYASYAAINYCSNLFFVGESLNFIDKKYQNYINIIQSMKQDFSLNYVKIWGQLVLNLMGKSLIYNRLIGERFNEKEMIPILQRKNNLQSLFVIDLAKTRLNYLFKKYTAAVKSAEKAVVNKQTLEGLLASAEHNFYYSLSLLADCPNQDVQKRKQYIEQVAANQKEMKTWADHAPMNFQHNYDLVEAEKARVLGQVLEAMKLYERAIKGARDNGYIPEQALAYELAANFYLAFGMEEFAKLYTIQAHYKYVCWQATAKVKDLEQRYPQSFARESFGRDECSFDLTKITTTDSKTSTELDLTSVLKASQTLSSEIVLSTLLEKMMKIVLENAGAQKGYLILSKQGQWTIEASGIVSHEFKVLPSIPIETVSSSNNTPIVPLSIINYASRTQEHIILNDAVHEGLFTRDPYIVKHQTKSVLCVPLLNQAKLAGFLYLENNLTTGAFTPDRLKVLKLLTTQVLISIENAKLYTDLQEYSQKLKVTNTKLLKANRCLEAEIRDRKQVQSQLHHAAFHDTLTGLPNRASFIDRLKNALTLAQQHKDYLFAVLFLDLDGFKVINDSLGHLVGDQFLIAIATRLEVCLGSRDTVARLGGDEFTVLLERLEDIGDALRVADRIQQTLSLPFHLNGQEVFTTASIGIALSVIGYERPEHLLRDADTAMYRAKALGRGRYELFNPDMYAHAVARLQLETDLRRALDRQEFRVYYQPIVSLTSGRITGFEALIRWVHPERGLVSPVDFIPVAEETGLIVAIGYWVLHQACLQMQAWRLRDRTNSVRKISVNLSIKQFSQPDLIEQIVRILHQTGLNASSLVLEITESVIMENSDRTTTLLSQLQNLGIELSIDDFGTGYSSLGRLHSFPICGLKIDRSFVGSTHSHGKNLEIIETIVTLAQKLGCEVTAEGVETPSQLALLRQLNCEYGQGYFFSYPLDSLAAEALIITNPLW